MKKKNAMLDALLSNHRQASAIVAVLREHEIQQLAVMSVLGMLASGNVVTALDVRECIRNFIGAAPAQGTEH